MLSNIVLDELDKELERRGHGFVRYADDANVYVRSRRAGERVMALLRKQYGRLRLKADPVAFHAELPPGNASRVFRSDHVWAYSCMHSAARRGMAPNIFHQEIACSREIVTAIDEGNGRRGN